MNASLHKEAVSPEPWLAVLIDKELTKVKALAGIQAVASLASCFHTFKE